MTLKFVNFCLFFFFFMSFTADSVFAQEASSPHSFLDIFKEFWDYQLLQVDQKSITLGKIILSFIVLVFGIFSSKLFTKLLSKKLASRLKLHQSSTHTIESFSFYILVTFFVLFALKAANIPLTVFNVIGGALAIGVGFGSQNIMNNFISGIILMVERPVKIGDFIKVEGVFGRIENIGTRSTVVISTGNKHLIIPNSKLIENRVDNWTLRNDKIKSFLKVGVVYGSPTDLVSSLIEKATLEETNVISNEGVEIIFEEFGDNSLVFEVYYYIRVLDHLDEKRVASAIRFNIEKLFKENNIVIAFPQRDLHIHQSQPFKVKFDKEN